MSIPQARSNQCDAKRGRQSIRGQPNPVEAELQLGSFDGAVTHVGNTPDASRVRGRAANFPADRRVANDLGPTEPNGATPSVSHSARLRRPRLALSAT
jgi:hypothetical protein